MKQIAIGGLVSLMIATLAFDALASNIPGYMLNGAIAYQILQRENPTTVTTARSILEKNPWYEPRWKAQLQKLPESARDEMLFMLATRWADDIRIKDHSLSVRYGITSAGHSDLRASRKLFTWFCLRRVTTPGC